MDKCRAVYEKQLASPIYRSRYEEFQVAWNGAISCAAEAARKVGEPGPSTDACVVEIQKLES